MRVTRIVYAAITRRPPRTPLAPTNQRITDILAGNSEKSLAQLLLQLASSKSSRTPSAEGYNQIVRLASDYTVRRNRGDEGTALGWEVAKAAIKDAEKANLDLDISRYLFEFATSQPSLLPTLLISESPSPAMYEALSQLAADLASPEQCAYLLREMLNRDFPPSRQFVQRTIELCCEWSYPRLALELAQRIEQASTTGVRVETSAWAHILISSAESQFLDGVETAWVRTVAARRYTPDEGLLLQLLDVAARWGRPDLATKYLDYLPDISVIPQEHHFVPLIEAFVNAGQVPQAIQVLSTMRSAGLTPTLRTAEPIASALTSAEIIDQAFYSIEDQPSGSVDVAALNALILASARLGDLQRVRATQTAASDLGITPDLDTFNLAFSGCVAAGHRPLGDTLLDEMAQAGIQPDATTYERMIHLCLIPVKYEDAFYYLERMKAEGYLPPYSVYRAILRKCVDSGDRRWKMVIEEVQSLGLRLDKELQTILEDVARGGNGRIAEGWTREEEAR